MEPVKQSSMSFWNKLQIAKETLSLVLTVCCLVGVILLFMNSGQGIECVIHHSISWYEIIVLAGGALALTVGLSVPLLQATAFWGIVYCLVRLWQCQ